MGQIKVTYDLDGIEGLCTIESTVHGDSRGYFMETFSQKDMYEAGLYTSFVQDTPDIIWSGSPDANIEIKSSEIEIRHYGDDQRLIEGRIYPLPRDEGINIMIHADQWIRELPPPDKSYFDENGVLILSSNAANAAKEERKPITWTVEFYNYINTIHSTTSSAPRSQHADEKNRLIVSAGLSNTARVPRVFNPIEVVYLESP